MSTLDLPVAVRDPGRTARWAGTMFLLVILLQRFAVPGVAVGMTLPAVFVWMYLAWRRGILEIDSRRFVFWCVAVGASGLIMVVQTMIGTGSAFSLSSWALLFVVWIPATVRFVDRRQETYQAFLAIVSRVCFVLAIVCIAQLLIQLAGVPYTDVLKPWVPRTMLELGFNSTSPVSFGAEVYRSNAWIGAEASMVSYQLGIGLLAAILARRPWWMIMVIVGGLFATVAGSGFIVVLAGLAALIVSPARKMLIKPLAPMLVLGGILSLTPYGQNLVSRSSEASSDSGSSASLRAVEPYGELWPTWSTDLHTAIFGGGPGASQRIMYDSPLRGLVPLPAKIFYDYGLIVGLIVAAFLLYCYVDGPSVTMAFTMFVSMWTVQPGSNIPILIVPLLLCVTHWAPRIAPRIEDQLPRSRGSGRKPVGRRSLPTMPRIITPTSS
jgi:hypothetical protein